ncbi:hypothetical protein DVS28_a1160 [Euzebya pacifica]|uniref:Flagellar protein n=1 Tax=Euzebya pacifica TaxID=1608957 RepID=A0A346XUG3_9ACTN|nr:flagellar biosynthetic protein FliO [Euzebya pacifica]AXV05860.1 hypothetical protein DVS28_a1160 [Euzebya pacifica]
MTDVSVISLLARLAVSMTVVIALMLLAARILRRTAGGMGIGGRGKERRTPIDVQTLQPLTKTAHVAVVRAAGRELVLGITDQQVTLLHSGIEPRDSLVDLDLDAADTTSETTTDDERISPLDVTSTRARIAPVPAEDATTPSALTAWTDALETLREKTVRR